MNYEAKRWLLRTTICLWARIFMCGRTHLLAYNSVNSSTVPDLLLSHHNWPLLFSEDHESIQWFFDIRMVFIGLVKRLCVTAKKQTDNTYELRVPLRKTVSCTIHTTLNYKHHPASWQWRSRVICLVYIGEKLHFVPKMHRSHLLWYAHIQWNSRGKVRWSINICWHLVHKISISAEVTWTLECFCEGITSFKCICVLPTHTSPTGLMLWSAREGNPSTGMLLYWI